MWRTDDMLLKFTSEGEFVRQLGGRDRHALAVGANTDTTSVHLATEAAVYPDTNEVFVADGYGNRRVLVLDAGTLAFKRMWGAFGRQPPPALGRGDSATANMIDTADPAGPEHFNSVHAVKVSRDGLVYVGDRSYRRIQVFTVDGEYVDQVFVNPTAEGFSTTSGIAFSTDPQQRFMYVADYENGQMHILDRKALTALGSFGTLGEAPGEFSRDLARIGGSGGGEDGACNAQRRTDGAVSRKNTCRQRHALPASPSPAFGTLPGGADHSRHLHP